MAQEIYFTYTLKVQNPTNPASGQVPFARTVGPESMYLTQNNVGESAGVLNVGTSAAGTALPVGGVTTSGICVLKNIDTTNYVQWGIKVTGTFYPVGRIKAGESFPVRIDQGATIYLVANTAAVNVEYDLLQD